MALLLGEARIRVLTGRAVPTLERAELIRRVRTAMADAPPEDLTVEELRVVLAVVEGAADRAPAVVGNVIQLAGRRPRSRTR
ncbi:hypothetical protein BN971_03252 [Mycobacterium bohemicum DSM 44277]|uniref:Uncharacterized protein n=1 Tax=Mycobacterium bohemicum DSM 44277 TaxID=1236609 RepID=A0A0U0WCQ4_MYCBE|nr:hypothetical protein [Mycobacterium bohemicum]MCV6968170.1 hypothetical protein [Mycobacterium bohemicum]CPR11959.1 hypothetical protein BN971_03252 [Mycobacterium bohemicum DSM 44277]